MAVATNKSQNKFQYHGFFSCCLEWVHWHCEGFREEPKAQDYIVTFGVMCNTSVLGRPHFRTSSKRVVTIIGG